MLDAHDLAVLVRSGTPLIVIETNEETLLEDTLRHVVAEVLPDADEAGWVESHLAPLVGEQPHGEQRHQGELRILATATPLRASAPNLFSLAMASTAYSFWIRANAFSARSLSLSLALSNSRRAWAQQATSVILPLL